MAGIAHPDIVVISGHGISIYPNRFGIVEAGIGANRLVRGSTGRNVEDHNLAMPRVSHIKFGDRIFGDMMRPVQDGVRGTGEIRLSNDGGGGLAAGGISHGKK